MHRSTSASPSQSRPFRPAMVLFAFVVVQASCEHSKAPLAPRDAPQFSSSAGREATGTIAFVSNRDGNYEIYVMNPDGSGVTPLTNTLAPVGHFDPAWSRNGKQIAFASNRDGNYEIYIMNDDGSGVTQLTSTESPVGNFAPAWCGHHIAWESDRDGPVNIYVMNDDGSGVTRFTDIADDAEPTWSPTCQQLAFQSNRDGPYNIYVMNADGTGVSRLTHPLALASVPAWPPNGHNRDQIAFASTRDGNNNVYVMNADGSGVTRLTNGVTYYSFRPASSPDGQQIAFESNRDAAFNNDIY